MKTSTLFAISVAISLFLLGILWLALREPTAADSAPGKIEGPGTENISDKPAKPVYIPLDYADAERGDIAAIPETKKCRGGILVDLGSRKVIWAKNTQEKLAIASLTKMMTAVLVMDSVRAGKLKMETPIKVTKDASKIATVWLDQRETFPLEILLDATIVRSANDCAHLLAETVADGNVEHFARMMNDKAIQLKMENTHFNNPHGLPGASADEDNQSTVEDLVRLAEAYMEYPELMKCSSTQEVILNSPLRQKEPTKLLNTNRALLNGLKGCNGLKTGFTQRAGYCVAASVERDGRKLLCVVTGFEKSSDREAAVKKLVDRVFGDFPPPSRR